VRKENKAVGTAEPSGYVLWQKLWGKEAAEREGGVKGNRKLGRITTDIEQVP